MATKSYGGDYSKYQPYLYNNTGSDSFAISQIGGSVNGYIYEQATYSSHAQQAKSRGWHFHTLFGCKPVLIKARHSRC